MPSLDSINLSQFLQSLKEYYKLCSMRQHEASFMSAIFYDEAVTEDNLTFYLIENLPTITEIEPPVLNKQESKNIYAMSPLARRYLNELAVRGEMGDKFEKQVEIRMHCIEMIQKLKVLKAAQDEMLRIFFMNRFRLFKELRSEITSNITIHCLGIARVSHEIGENILMKTDTLIKDIELVYGN